MRSVVVERDGLRIAAIDYGGDGEPLLLLHPNGFCAGWFDPLARRLTGRFRPISVDLRGHGATDAPTGGPSGFAFARMADDVWAVLDELGVTGLAALGESLGGGVAVLVAAARPGTVRRLMLCEAIAFDLDVVAPRPAGQAGDGGNFMATIARKRRDVWPDRETVRASYASRPPLDVLAPEVLDAYVRWGFVDRPDGQVELACSPEVEATIFEVSSHDQGARAAWKHLDAVAGAAVVLHGDASDLPTEWFAAQAARVCAEPVIVPGGHFFLQEDTTRAEALVRKHLA